MNEQTMIKDLTTGRPIRQLIMFSFPFVLSNLLQQLYNLADMIIIGHYVGSAGLSAASNAGEFAMLFLFACIGFTAAGQIIISQHIGAGSRDRISYTFGTMFSFSLALGAVLTVVSVCSCDQLLTLINIPEESFAYAHDYSIVCYFGMIPVFGYNAVGSALRGMGDSKHPFIFIAISSFLNVVLDLLFVGGFDMGCFGAALATVMGQTVSFIIAIIYLYRNRRAFGFDFKPRSFIPDKREFKAMISLGLPLALQNCAISVSMLYINSYINAYGLVASAATGVGNKITHISTIFTVSLNTAGSSIIAQNFASKKYDRVSKTILYIFVLCFAFCGVIGLLLLLMPEQIFSLFDTNPEVLAMSHLYAPIGLLSFIGASTRAPSMAFINGLGFSRLSFVTGMMDGIVARIGLSLLFGITLGMGVRGFWLGSALAGYMFGIVGLLYYIPGRWKKRKLLVSK